ncbi:MAG TPA: hypothetical protein VGC13_22315 [Longimicrobium sp.]|uniref:phage major capsid protein n=1 Tax=Longimicrobium sp. TaxID=2029185 RepID=UPI002EDA6C83
MSGRARGGRVVRLQASAAALSLTDRVRAVEEALWARNRASLNDADDPWYVVETYEDHTVARRGPKTFRVSYTIGADGKVVFGEPEEVEAKYVAVEASIHVDVAHAGVHLLVGGDAGGAAAAASAEPEGLEWEVTVIRAGMSSAAVEIDGQTYPVFFTEEYVRLLAPLLANAPVYALDDTAGGHKHNAGEKLQEQVVGWTADPRLEGAAVQANLVFDRENPRARQKRADLVHAWQRGNRTRWGLSIDSRGMGELRPHRGATVYFATRPDRLLSTDIVLRPAAGGVFNRIVASAAAEARITVEEVEMNRERLIAAIRASRPEVLRDKDLTTISMAELALVANEAELRAAATGGAPAPTAAGRPAVDETAIADRVAAAVEQRLQARGEIETIITSSQLPAGAQATVRRLLAIPGVTAESIQAAVDEQRATLAAAAPAHVAGLGGPALLGGAGGYAFGTVGVEAIDRIQAAFDRALGVEPENPELKTIRPIGGLLELYQLVTAGQDYGVHGISTGAQLKVIQAAGFDESTLPSVMENTLNRRLAMDYAEISFGDEFLVSTEGSMKDFRPQSTTRLGYLGNFPTLNTDTQEYPSVNAYGEERAIYEGEERGMIIEFTRKHILNDDMSAVQKVPGRIAWAGKRTVAEFLFSFLTLNPVIPYTPGTLTWFHASRNNLMTAPLSVAGLNQARLLLATQTEPSSGKRLGLPGNVQVHLWVPSEQLEAARGINQSKQVPGSANNDANPWYHKFGEKDEFIHEVYSWDPADSGKNDWALSVDPKHRGLIEIKYLNGQKIPQIVRQDAANVGKVFTQGKISLKAFLDFGGTPEDTRGIVKSVVANP